MSAKISAARRAMNRCEYPPDIRSRVPGDAATCSFLKALEPFDKLRIIGE